MPIFSIVIGRMVNTLGYGTPDGLTAELNQTTLFFLYLAIASFVVCYLEVGMWMLTGRTTCPHTTQEDSTSAIGSVTGSNIQLLVSLCCQEYRHVRCPNTSC